MQKCTHTKTKYISRNSKLLFPSFDITLKQCVDLCEYGSKSRLCYALNNPRTMIFNKKKLEQNEKLLNSNKFISELRKEILLSNTRKFRFFASGDIYKIEHIDKIHKLSESLPNIKFWLSTHADFILFEYYKFSKPPENLNIILSNKIPNSQAPKFLVDWLHSKNMNISTTTNEKSLSNCHASTNRTSCDLCENCFNQMDIVYYLHGTHAKKRLEKYEN